MEEGNTLNAANDEHVVRATMHFAHSRHRATAFPQLFANERDAIRVR